MLGVYLGPLSKPGTVLEFACPEDSKSVPEYIQNLYWMIWAQKNFLTQVHKVRTRQKVLKVAISWAKDIESWLTN